MIQYLQVPNQMLQNTKKVSVEEHIWRLNKIFERKAKTKLKSNPSKFNSNLWRSTHCQHHQSQTLPQEHQVDDDVQKRLAENHQHNKSSTDQAAKENRAELGAAELSQQTGKLVNEMHSTKEQQIDIAPANRKNERKRDR